MQPRRSTRTSSQRKHYTESPEQSDDDSEEEIVEFDADVDDYNQTHDPLRHSSEEEDEEKIQFTNETTENHEQETHDLKQISREAQVKAETPKKQNLTRRVLRDRKQIQKQVPQYSPGLLDERSTRKRSNSKPVRTRKRTREWEDELSSSSRKRRRRSKNNTPRDGAYNLRNRSPSTKYFIPSDLDPEELERMQYDSDSDVSDYVQSPRAKRATVVRRRDTRSKNSAQSSARSLSYGGRMTRARRRELEKQNQIYSPQVSQSNYEEEHQQYSKKQKLQLPNADELERADSNDEQYMDAMSPRSGSQSDETNRRDSGESSFAGKDYETNLAPSQRQNNADNQKKTQDVSQEKSLEQEQEREESDDNQRDAKDDEYHPEDHVQADVLNEEEEELEYHSPNRTLRQRNRRNRRRKQPTRELRQLPQRKRGRNLRSRSSVQRKSDDDFVNMEENESDEEIDMLAHVDEEEAFGDAMRNQDSARYRLRPRNLVNPPKKMPPANSERRRKRPSRRIDFNSESSSSDSDSSSSSSSSSNAPGLLSPTSKKKKKRRKAHKHRADIDPMDIDKSVTWDSVGGLDHHIHSLKEMVILPLLYPDVFEKFNVKPPRGVLFFGPPGTGKTLVARALSNTCSSAGTPVSFFMRKGADILSKWVGEAEKQLRLLFQEAKKRQPSIIFFDEIDGLAPVRSSKQDYIHSSIVSTLLALMDGLDNRGQVVVIGATNRIDALDPALRRPGRFDRELTFTLPSRKSRKQIIDIHTASWGSGLSEELKKDLSRMCVGYCGADIKALCAESALHALRRVYPQIYKSNVRLKLDLDRVQVTRQDFVAAMNKITPAAHRSAVILAQPVPHHLSPILDSSVVSILQLIGRVFPPSHRIVAETVELFKNTHSSQDSDEMFPTEIHDDPDEYVVEDPLRERYNEEDLPDGIGGGGMNGLSFHESPPTFKPWILISGASGMGQKHVGPAVLHKLEEFQVFSLALPSLLSTKLSTPEESIVQMISEARRSAPSVVYIPNVHHLFSAENERIHIVLEHMLREISSTVPVLVLATTELTRSELPEAFTNMFPEEHAFEMPSPSSNALKKILSQIIADIKRPPLRKKLKKNIHHEELPPASPLKSGLSAEAKERRKKDEEETLRGLRILLRDTVLRIIGDRRFSPFVKPVDPEEVPDYYNVIEKPLCLFEILDRIEEGKYTSANTFLDDIQQIVENAESYNPTDTFVGRRIISRAHQMRDMVRSAVHYFDKKLMRRCEEITKQRAKEEAEQQKEQHASQTSKVSTGEQNATRSHDTDGTSAAQEQGTDVECREKEQNEHTEEETAQEPQSIGNNSNENENKTSTNKSNEEIANMEVEYTTTPNCQNNSVNDNPNSEQEKRSQSMSIKETDISNVSPQQDKTESMDNHDANHDNTTNTQREEQKQENDEEKEHKEQEDEDPLPAVFLDSERLDVWQQMVMDTFRGSSVEKIDELYSKIYSCIYKWRFSADKNRLLDDLENIVKTFT